MRHLIFIAAALAAFAAATPVLAADAIATDRPDYVESSNVVGPGRFQIETAFQSERAEPQGVTARLRTTPTLLRFGIGETLELRVETDGRAWATVEAPGGARRLKGWSDASFGVKWRAQESDEKSGRPGVALLLHADVDTGSSAFRGDGVRPSLRAVAEWELPRDFSFGVMPGIVLDRNEDGRRYLGGILAATFGKAWTPTWRSFIEIAGQQLASRRNGGSIVTFDAGVAWQVGNDLQLDLSLQRGLSREAPDFVWALGASIRF